MDAPTPRPPALEAPRPTALRSPRRRGCLSRYARPDRPSTGQPPDREPAHPTHRGQDRRRTGQRQLVEEYRRPVVQEMGVVDEHHQRTPPCALGHGPDVAPEQLTVVLPGKGVTSWVGRQHRRERSEGQPPRSMGGGRADQRHPPLLGHLRAHNGQCRLAYAGGTGDQPPVWRRGRSSTQRALCADRPRATRPRPSVARGAHSHLGHQG